MRREPGSLIQEPTNAPTQTIRIDVHPENVGLTMPITPKRPRTPDSSYAWWRLAAALALSTIGGVGLWSAVVVLPTVEAAFGVDRGGASVPYTATMVGFAAGGVVMGRLADRFGVVVPLVLGALMLGVGYVVAAS